MKSVPRVFLLAMFLVAAATTGVVAFDWPLTFPHLIQPTQPGTSTDHPIRATSPTPGPVVTQELETIVNSEPSVLAATTSVLEPTAPVNINRALAQIVPAVGTNRILFFTDTQYLGALAPGDSGQFLMSQGTGQLPIWGSVSTTNNITNVTNNASYNTTISGTADWGTPGAIGSSVPNTGVFTSLTLAGGSVPLQIGGSSQLQVDNNGRLTLGYIGDSGFLSSSGGALFLDNTNNIGTAIGIFSNAGADAMGNMINVKVDNPNYAQAAFYMNYDGSSNAVEIVSNSNDSSSNALAVTGNNINDSTLGIIGYELGKGTIKVTHNRPPGGTDSNASGLSIDLKGSGTRAQGVYVDSTEVGGTLGNLLRLRNETIDRFVVGPTGNVTFAGNMTQGANGTDTTYTKYGNVAGDEFFIGVTGAFRVQRSASNSEAFRTQIAGDTQGRWVGTSDGRLRWGDGSNATDVTLRRGAAGVLWLDGGLVMNNSNGDFDVVIKGFSDNNLLFADASRNAIGIGTSAPLAGLHINKNGNGNAAFLVNQLGSSDLMTASASGTTRFRVTNDGTIVSSAGSLGIGTSEFGTNAAQVIALAGSTAPTTSITNGIQLFAVDVAGSHELQVRDEAGNVTTLSPHNFSLIPQGRSEDLAWAFYSERDGLAINADVTRALRLIESLTGEDLVFVQDLRTGTYLDQPFGQGLSLTDMAVFKELQQTSGQQADWTTELQTHFTWHEKIISLMSEAVFKARVVFEHSVTFMARVVFKQGLEVQGPLTVSEHISGWAAVPAGVKKVRVKFTQPFDQPPVVYLDDSETTHRFVLEEVTTDGFTLRTDHPSTSISRIKWLAVMADQVAPSEVEVLVGEEDQTAPQSTPDSLASPSPSLSPQVAGEQTVAEPETMPSPPASPTPTPSPIPAASPVAEPSPVSTPSVTASPSPTP